MVPNSAPERLNRKNKSTKIYLYSLPTAEIAAIATNPTVFRRGAILLELIKYKYNYIQGHTLCLGPG